MTPPPLAIQLFGPLRVMVGGEPMPRVRTRSVEWLLALLTLRHGRAVQRAWLAGTLWPESSGTQALQNLRSDLVRLRQALGPESGRLQSPTRDTLTIDLAGAVVDMVQFDAAIHAGDEASLGEAVRLYTGPLLEDCVEEWVLSERAARTEQYLTALETLADRAAERGEHGEAIRYLRRAEALDPLRDSLPRRLMESLAAAGDPAAAIQTYRDFRVRLQEELAAAPDEATTRLFQEIRAATRHQAAQRRLAPPPAPDQATADTPGAPSSLSPRLMPEPVPRPLTSLIGRELELVQIPAALEQSRLVTLVGGGGVGKTRLALEVAHQVSREAPDGAAWVELAPLADGGPLLASLAAALGLRVEGGGDAEALTRQLVARLSDGSFLLVLDNCEHLLDAAAAAVRTLLQGCPELRVLATSRQRLGLAGEVVWRVPSLPVPVDGSWLMVDGPAKTALSDPSTINQEPSTLLQCPSVRLFVERAAAVRPGFQLGSGAEAAAVGQICRRLDGIPLALELAAARARVLTPQQIAARLHDRFSLLTGGARGALPRHQTLRALIDWSYDSLPEVEATLLRRLSVFAGGWTLEAAEVVCCGEGVGCQVLGVRGSDPTPNTQPLTPDVLDLLDALVDRSLVLVDEAAGTPDDGAQSPAARVPGGWAPGEGLRYRMLETVRQYAGELLEAAGERGAIRKQHWEWYLRLVERERATANRPGQRGWLLRPERELDNLRVALQACHEAAQGHGDRAAAEAGLRLASALHWFWFSRGYLAEGLAALDTALDDSADHPAALRAPALGAAGFMAGALGDPARGRLLLSQSRQAYETVLQDVRMKGDHQEIARTVLSLMNTCDWLHDPDSTWTYGQEARQLMEELGDAAGLARALEAMAGVARSRGEPETARPLLEEQLAIGRRLGTPSSLMHALGALGHLERDEGNFQQARAYYQESLLVRQEVGDKFTMAQSLEDLAVLAGHQGQTGRAIRLLGAAEALWKTLGFSPPAADATLYQPTMAAGRAALGEAAVAAAWAEGRSMSIEQAVEYAMAAD